MLYVCEKCNCVDSDDVEGYDGSLTCTECRTGTWHHYFTKKQYNPSEDRGLINRPDPTDDTGSEVSLG